ncbi:MAG: helix-turn-helix domain-containing protein [Thermoplasmata archaeon]|nr:helix-turn-helix domain-containing protein [Thermoplasmata archaeon]
MSKIPQFEESETVEIKSSLIELKKILEALSAFSNSKGGKVFVGIDDSGQIKGVDIGKNTLENLANDIKRNTDPPLFPSIAVEVLEKKKIISIEVNESPIKPVFAFDRAFKRVGRTNQRLTSIELRELSRFGVGYCFTAQAVKGATLDDISEEAIRKFVETSKERRGWTVKYSSKQDFLAKMGLIGESNLTIAAVLLFGTDPQQYVIQSETKCGRFKGTKPLEFEDFDVIGGDLFSQVDGLMNSIKRNLKLGVKIVGKPERIEQWEYPLDAIWEGIVNGICHRDYGETSNVQVRIFDDRLEIWSPGKLPPGITVEKLKGEHESVPPNSLIAKPFFLVGLIENWGTGTNRMLEECEKAGMPEPEFKDTGTSFVITFRKDIYTEKYLLDLGLNGRQIRAVRYVKEKGKIANKEFQELNGCFRNTATNDLKDLVRKGIFKESGKKGVGSYYEIA